MTRRVLLVEIGSDNAALPATTPPATVNASWVPAVYVPPALPAPINVQFERLADAVLLSWLHAAAAFPEYVVERAPDQDGVPGAWAEVARTRNRRYTDAVPAGNYWWRIRTTSFGKESEPTQPLAASPMSAGDPIGGSGNNLLWDEYTRFQTSTVPVISSPDAEVACVPDPDAIAGYSLVGITATTDPSRDYAYLGATTTDYIFPLEGGRKYLLSFYAKANVSGHEVLVAFKGSDDNFYYIDGGIGAGKRAVGGSLLRYSGVLDLSAFEGSAGVFVLYFNRSGALGVRVYWDRLMVEPLVGRLTEPSPWTPGLAGRRALLAIADAADAKAAADGKIQLYRGASFPTAGAGQGIGDFFIKSPENHYYTWDGNSWEDAQDTEVAEALGIAAGAQATADGKAAVFFGESAPTPTGPGDLWWQESVKTLWQWSGAAWVPSANDSSSAFKVINPSFERGLVGWSAVTNPNGLFVYTQTAASGSKCLRREGAAGGDRTDWINDQEFTLRPGGRVKVSYKVRSAGATPNGNAYIYYREYNEDGVYLGAGAPGSISGGVMPYTAVAAIITNTGDGLRRYRVGFGINNHTVGAYLVDDYDVDFLPSITEESAFYAGSGNRVGDQRNLPQSNTTAYGSVRTTTALSATGSGAVSINAHTVRYGAVSVSYNAVANALTGLTSGVTYVIYCFDDGYQGGTRTWYAGTNPAAVMALGDGVVVAGQIKIPASGGTGTGGGGGTGDPEDWCVDWDCQLPDGRFARELKPGDLAPCWDGNADQPGVEMVPLVAIAYGEALSHNLSSANGSIDQSDTTPMDLRDGRIARTPDMLGEYVLPFSTREWEPVEQVTPLGMRRVVKLNFGGRMFFAGNAANSALATHNAQVKP